MDEISHCTQEAILSAPNACEYVQIWCENQYDYLNFIGFYYCDLNANVPLIVIFSILFILFAFNLLGTTADRYLAPALEVITQNLKISEAIAGVTLLALANGATDVIAGIVAGGKESGGVEIAIGALFGACLFTITCVLARCIQGAGTIKTDSGSLKRDIVFLLIAVVYFVVLAIIGEITPLLAAGFFLIYALYFAYVLYQEKKNDAPKETVRERLLDIHNDYKHQEAKSKSLNLDTPDPDFFGPYLIKQHLHNKRKSVECISYFPIGDEKKEALAFNEILGLDSNSSKCESDDEEEDNPTLGRFLRIWNAPFFFIRDLTMPPFEEERWNVYATTATPFFGVLFAIWQFGFLETFLHTWQLWIVYAVITVPCALWIFIKGRKENLVKEHSGKFAAITFVVSALWLNFIANCFMDFLSLLTAISSVPLNYLSLTVLAWGNSLDDFFVDYYVAKSGHGAMAVTGVYAGQLFNLLIGFGGAMFRQSLMGTVQPNIFHFDAGHALTNVLNLGLIGSLIACLVLTLVMSKMNQWKLGKKTMMFLLIFYIGFFLVATVLSVSWNHLYFI